MSPFTSAVVGLLLSTSLVVAAPSQHPERTPSPSNVLQLTRRSIPNYRHKRSTSGTSTLASMTGNGKAYSAPVTIGTQTFHLMVDTGSSDTWVASQSFNCTPDDPADKRNCDFGDLYAQSYDKIKGQYFDVGYGSEEHGIGYVAYETVSFADISIDKQEVGIVELTNWISGDGGANSGLIGLSYPNLQVKNN
jgi:phage baseplate assembly protein gpV